MRPRSALSILLLALGGCAVENPASILDSTGAELGWDCDRGTCAAVERSYSPTVPACGPGAEYVVGNGALAILCVLTRAAGGGDLVHQETCRPLVCRDGLDCPQYEGRSYYCVEGLCQSSQVDLDALDAVALCLWDVERLESCDSQLADPRTLERIALAQAACPEGRCALPLPRACLQP
ncbi:MAG: hypothetical protein K8H88_30810 [Sandaracinaceae bacterium]|nr:hypothetical protein [Sandaracinaceae bacterium]